MYWPEFFRKRASNKSIFRVLRSLYGRAYGAKLIRGKKLPDKYIYYGGADWYTLSSKCVMLLLRFIEKENAFNELFVHSLSGAEIYYPSIVYMVSNGEKIEFSNCLRYIDWKNRGYKNLPGSPNAIHFEMIPEIEQAKDKFFARKFDEKQDACVIRYFLEKTIYN